MSASGKKRAGLGTSFAAPETAPRRGEGLNELLKAGKPAPLGERVSAEPVVQPATRAVAQPVVQQPPTATSPRAAVGRPRGSARKRNTPVYLTDAVQDALRARAGETRQSYAEITVEAFRSVERIEELFLPIEPAVEDDEIPAAPVSPADRFPTGTNLVNIRFTDQQRAWLDKQWVAKGASSRSMFVSTVLTVYLTGGRTDGNQNAA